MIYMVFLVFAGLIVGDDFSCSLYQLRRALPHLKSILNSKNYEKLKALHDQITVEVNESQGKKSKSSAQVGALILDVIDKGERAKCLAALQIQHGYYSMTDARIAGYLELDKDQVEKIRTINRKAVSDMTDRVFKMRASEDYNTVFSDLKKFYQDAVSAVKQVMAEKQRSQLDELYQDYPHDTAIRELMLRFMREKISADASAKAYQEYQPNIQQHMRSEGLIIMDFKVAREYLGMNSEQEKEALNLFRDYTEAVEELQLSLANTINGSSIEMIRMHMGAAMKLGQEYRDRFLKLLRDDQVRKLPVLLAQVLGYKYCFTPPIREQVGISPEQEDDILKFMTKQQAKYPADLKRPGLDSEKLYQREMLMSKAIHDEVLTEEQREKWKKIIGKPIPESDLKPLSKAYFLRTNYWIKNPLKK